jgi:hypothetical protein
MTKRRLEEAAQRQAGDPAGTARNDIWAETLGAWNRKEQPQETVRAALLAFRRSFERRRRTSSIT